MPPPCSRPGQSRRPVIVKSAVQLWRNVADAEPSKSKNPSTRCTQEDPTTPVLPTGWNCYKFIRILSIPCSIAPYYRFRMLSYDFCYRMWHPSVVLENDRSNHHVNWYDIQSSQMEKARGSVAGNAMYSDVSPRAFFTQLNNAFNWVVPTVTTTVASSTVFTGVTTTTSKQTFGVSKCTPATFAFSDCEAAVKKTPGKWDYDGP